MKVPISSKNEEELVSLFEVSSKWEVLLSIFTFFSISVLTIFITIFGPKLQITETAKNTLEMKNNSAYSVFYMKFTNLKPSNKYHYFSIIFSRQNTKGKIIAPLITNLTLKYFKNNITIREKTIDNIESTITSSRFMPKSDPYYFLKETTIDFDTILMNSSFEIFTRAFQFSTFSWEYCSSMHEEMILYIRLIYAFIHLLLLVAMIYKLQKFKFSMWKIEHKFTLILLVSSVLVNNPLKLLEFYFHSAVLDILDNIFGSFFVSFLIFYFLVMVDLLRFENITIEKSFFINKIIFSLIYFSFLIVYSNFKTFKINIHEYSNNNIGSLFHKMNLIFLIITTLYILFSLKNTNKRKLIRKQIYIKLYFATIISGLFFEIIGIFTKPINAGTNIGPFDSILTHAVSNLIVMFLTEIHFPESSAEGQDFNEVSSGESSGDANLLLDEPDLLDEKMNQLDALQEDKKEKNTKM